MLSFLHGVHSWARWWPRGKILFPYTVHWLMFAQKRENFLISDPRLQSSERINACCPKAPSCLVLCYSSLQKLIHHIQVKRKKKKTEAEWWSVNCPGSPRWEGAFLLLGLQSYFSSTLLCKYAVNLEKMFPSHVYSGPGRCTSSFQPWFCSPA